MFDSDAFNRTLFFPRAEGTDAPPGADDCFVAVDGAVLHMRIHRCAGARATVLFFHGNGEVVADYDEAASSFAAAGAALAVVDYRGYGRSTGTPSLRAIMADAHAVLAALLPRVGEPVIVMGRSLGSACAIELYAAERLPAKVVGVVLESGFTSLPRLAQRRALAAPAQMDAIFDPIAKLARGDRPLLVLHGARDTLILPDEAEVAWRSAGSASKELVLIEGRGHNDIAVAPAYWSALAQFVRLTTT